MRVSSRVTPVFGVALCLLHLFAKLLDLVAQRSEKISEVVLAGLGEGF